MNLQLIKEEDLIGLTNPWPMKDAAEVWQKIREMTFRQFNVFVLAYMTNLNWKANKRGRGTDLERIARAILFKMSVKQRAYSYKLIMDKYNKAIEHGWWNDDVSALIQATSKQTYGTGKHRETGYVRRLLDKRKHVIDDETTIRLKLMELTSIIDQHKEYTLVHISTTNNYNTVTEQSYNTLEEAKAAFYDMEI